MPISPRIDKELRQKIQRLQRGPNTCGWIPVYQSGVIALSQAGHQPPIWGQTREIRAYGLRRTVAAKQRRFDKAQTLSMFTPEIAFSIYCRAVSTYDHLGLSPVTTG